MVMKDMNKQGGAKHLSGEVYKAQTIQCKKDKTTDSREEEGN